MAVPFLLGAVAVGTALYGAYKGVNGVIDQNTASDLNAQAQALAQAAQDRVESRRDRAKTALEAYGLSKMQAFEGSIPAFIAVFGALKNVELIRSPELDRLKIGGFTEATLEDLDQTRLALESAGLGLGAGAVGGAAIAFGAYNGTMLLAAASTGTAISSLSGVAATNATLAWLGGGSIASGGMGMAAGTMVLGAIAIGPALAIFGHIVGGRGETALNKARINMEQAQTIDAEADLAIAKLVAIEEVALLARGVLLRVDLQLEKAVEDLRAVVAAHGTDYRRFPEPARATVFRAAKFAQLIKAMIDAPILDEDGAPALSTKKRVIEIGEAIA